MGVLLVVVLVFKLSGGLPPVEVGLYETEEDCRKALKMLDALTQLPLDLVCEVRT